MRILRYRADVRTVLWALAMPVVMASLYVRPDLIKYLWPLSFYLALAAGVMAHNHNHCTTFTNKTLNQIYANWLSLFYGYPTFAWVPTHNLNHHKFVNRAGDATITWRYGNQHSTWLAITYFFWSSYYQSDPIKQYLRKARQTNPPLYRRVLVQYGCWAGAAVACLAAAVAVHGWKTGLFTWVFASVLPALFALWTIMLFNYGQHVHTDPWSEHNHSRSFESWSMNFLLFNNGYHAAHHESPGTHWSLLREAHQKIRPEIHPALVRHSMWWWFIGQYLVGPFFPQIRTKQVGRAPFDPPDGSAVDIASAEVGIGDAGTNALMA